MIDFRSVNELLSSKKLRPDIMKFDMSMVRLPYYKCGLRPCLINNKYN